MSVRMKVFAAMCLLIAFMGIMYVFVSQVIYQESVRILVEEMEDSNAPAAGEKSGMLYERSHRTLEAMLFVLLIGVAVLLILSLLLAYMLSRKLTNPLRRLIPFMDQIGRGRIDVRVPVVTTDEYGQISMTINEMVRRLERAERLRKQQLEDVAHELRTPLAIMSGKLEWIQENGREVEPKSLLPMQDELIRLTRLVEDLHQISLAEVGQLPLDLHPVSLKDILQAIVDHMREEAEEKRIHLAWTCPLSDTTLQADAHRLTQVFLNVLINAIRYTPSEGAISIHLDEEPGPEAGARRFSVTISDTGPGIAEEHLPFLFERFYRADENRSSRTGGRGLGLAIAKQYTEAHNGSIEVRSKQGEGTTFKVGLPVG